MTVEPAGVTDVQAVHGLVVDRSASGAGVGRELLGWARDEALRRGSAVLRLDCVAGNPALRRYHLAAGFAEVGTRDLGGTWGVARLFEQPVLDSRVGGRHHDDRRAPGSAPRDEEGT